MEAEEKCEAEMAVGGERRGLGRCDDTRVLLMW
jgi:hypothetical protein